MRDLLTILRKEILELVGNRHSFYGAVIQTAILIAMCGIFVPSDDPEIWSHAGSVAMLYAIFPALLAATLAADAFAGERERKTLETLLATPIAERSLFFGKLGAAVLLAGVGATLSIVAGIISSTVVAGALPVAVTPAHLVVVLFGALGYASLTAVIATQISMRVAVARTAQQMSSMLTMAITGVTAVVLAHLHVAVDWHTLPQIAGVALAVGVACVFLGDGAVRRDRIFDPERGSAGARRARD